MKLKGKKMTEKIKMHHKFKDKEEWYESECGLVLKREYKSLSPGGNEMGGRWVLRENMDILIDWGQYRNDIAEHNNLDLIGDY